MHRVSKRDNNYTNPNSGAQINECLMQSYQGGCEYRIPSGTVHAERTGTLYALEAMDNEDLQ